MNESGVADFAEMRRRLEAVSLAIAHGFAPAEEDELRILKTRAAALALEETGEDAAVAAIEVVVFDLASERYAFPLLEVSGVTVLKELTPVPCTPPFIVGIINLRGEIRTVLDLKQFFDLPSAAITELNKIILIQHHGRQLGILADAIRGVLRIPLADLQATLPTLTDRRADYLRGITPDCIVVLDPVKILADQRIVVDEEVSS